MEKYAIVIAGPSGAGKTTVAESLIETLGTLEMSRSATTRAKRGDGKDDEYVYISIDEFRESIKSGDVLEYTEYSGNYYGTRKCELDRILGIGKHPILVLDYNGARALKERLGYPVFNFYVYTTLNEAERRLIARDLISDADNEKKRAILEKRNFENRSDFGKLHTMTDIFDMFVENRTVEKCTEDIIHAIEELKQGKTVMSEEEKKKITEDFLEQIK